MQQDTYSASSRIQRFIYGKPRNTYLVTWRSHCFINSATGLGMTSNILFLWLGLGTKRILRKSITRCFSLFMEYLLVRESIRNLFFAKLSRSWICGFINCHLRGSVDYEVLESIWIIWVQEGSFKILIREDNKGRIYFTSSKILKEESKHFDVIIRLFLII